MSAAPHSSVSVSCVCVWVFCCFAVLCLCVVFVFVVCVVCVWPVDCLKQSTGLLIEWARPLCQAVKSRFGPKRGFGETPGELLTISKPNHYPKFVHPPPRKSGTKPNLWNPFARFDGGGGDLLSVELQTSPVMSADWRRRPCTLRDRRASWNGGMAAECAHIHTCTHIYNSHMHTHIHACMIYTCTHLYMHTCLPLLRNRRASLNGGGMCAYLHTHTHMQACMHHPPARQRREFEWRRNVRIFTNVKI